ncbi:FAD-binding protein [Aliiroseovarius sp. KMU-50]|uniref:FAD-binding protein n=1 Tax=Aliiroseovarius salicola TaxID=3009082 RepID=A0ABT4W1C9_9RHOB|nr:FAD-binding protein [Aliiroseovarius sp. KMU-50]MDA5093573.1 FAD-binding protein [Aliiroseovarius sp. KMU-50]
MRPESEIELAELVADATGPMRIQGGGTRQIGAPVDGEVLSVAGLSGVTLYEPGALTLVAKAGTPVEEIEALLAENDQMLGFEPMDHRRLLGTSGTPTIGGVIAGNVSGPRRLSSVGACRDSLLGVRFVDGAGRILKNGGRVMKNVTGYDLVKLMAGSRGTLGVLTEVSLKVLPRPEAVATLSFEGLDPGLAVPLMSKALGSPYDVTGAYFGPYHYQAPRHLHLRLEGSSASVKYRADALAGLLSGFGAARIERDPDASQQLWRDIRDMTHLAEMPFVTRSSIKPGAAPAFVESISQVWAATHYLDWGGGLIWTAASEEDLCKNAKNDRGDSSEDELTRGAKALIAAMHEAMSFEDGHTTLIKADERVRREMPSFQPRHSVVASLELGLRQKFDPRGILNPGLMGA